MLMEVSKVRVKIIGYVTLIISRHFLAWKYDNKVKDNEEGRENRKRERERQRSRVR